MKVVTPPDLLHQICPEIEPCWTRTRGPPGFDPRTSCIRFSLGSNPAGRKLGVHQGSIHGPLASDVPGIEPCWKKTRGPPGFDPRTCCIRFCPEIEPCWTKTRGPPGSIHGPLASDFPWDRTCRRKTRGLPGFDPRTFCIRFCPEIEPCYTETRGPPGFDPWTSWKKTRSARVRSKELLHQILS
jgi:hypothetical protein